MRVAARALLVLLVLAPAAAASSHVRVHEGGEPGVLVTVAGRAIADAATPGDAIEVDPRQPLALSISIAPPAGETWEVRAVSVGLVVRGPGTEPPASLMQRTEATATLPPGYTVVIERTVDLAPVARLGAGTFLMQAEVWGAEGERLFVDTFYVRVPPSIASFLTVQGAALTAMSAATGYGLWSLARDVKELRDAWARHRKRREAARLDVIGRAEEALERTVAKRNAALAGAVSVHRAAEETERTLGPVRWAATGMGLGAVVLAWGQFLGYFALDLTSVVVVAAETSAAFLTVALVANALVRRRARTRVHRVPVLTEPPAAEPQPLEAVQPSDKRG